MVTKVIPAKPQARGNSMDRNRKKLRVAAYARVSTDKEEQESSYEAQCSYYTNLITSDPNYIFAGIYADEGITGMSTRKREQFNQMIRDCEAGKIDLVFTKSISRWARNTVDSLENIRRLKALGVDVWFEKENLWTMDLTGEVIITIMSSLAQAESESISRNVRIGLRYRFQEGKACGGNQRLLGLERTEDGRLRIIPMEAEIVRLIFRLFLDGYSPRQIGEKLKKRHLQDRTGKERSWNQSSIRYILENPKYSGDMLLQRYYVSDLLNKKSKMNNGELPQYYVENSHPPIIPKEVFNRAQAELALRREYQGQRGIGVILCGKIFCGRCGMPYIRRKEDGGTRVYYRCGQHIMSKGYRERKGADPDYKCDACTIKEAALYDAIIRAMNELPGKREELIRLQERINWGAIAQADRMIEGIKGRLEELDAETVDTEDAATDGAETVVADVNTDGLEDSERYNLEAQLEEATRRRAEFAEREMAIRNLLDRIDAIEGRVEAGWKEYAPSCETADEFFERTRHYYRSGKAEKFTLDDSILFIDKVVIGEKVRVEFKAGVSIEVEADMIPYKRRK